MVLLVRWSRVKFPLSVWNKLVQLTLVQIQIQIKIQIQIQKPSLRNAKFEISSLLENKLTLQRKCSWFNWHWSRPARSNWSTFASNWSIFWIGQYSKFDNISSESIFWIGQYVASWGLLYRTWVRPLHGLVTNLLTQLKNAVEWSYSGHFERS